MMMNITVPIRVTMKDQVKAQSEERLHQHDHAKGDQDGGQHFPRAAAQAQKAIA